MVQISTGSLGSSPKPSFWFACKTHFSLLFCLTCHLRPTMSSSPLFAVSAYIVCSFLIFHQPTIVVCPVFALGAPQILLSHEFMPLVGCGPPCCSSTALRSSLSSSLSLHHLWHSWPPPRGPSPHEDAGSLRSQLYHQALQCFGLEEQTLRCAIPLVHL